MANPLVYLIPTPGNVVTILQFLIGVVYPTFESFKAVESVQSKDDTQWLSYWVVFAVYTSVEALSWPVLRWIPMYGILKIGVTVWMVIPQYQGATYVYRTYIRPTLYRIVEKAKEVPQLEPYVRDFNPSVTRAMRDVANKAEDVVKMTEPKPQPTPPEDPFAPLKTHSQ